MTTLRNNLSGVRVLLGYPDPHEPNDPLLFELLSNQAQHHFNQLQNGGGPWSVDKWTLQAAPGKEDYIISAQNFGKPFLCYTTDPADDQHVRCEVPFILMQNAGQFYHGPAQVDISDRHSIQYLSFYRQQGSFRVRATPIPGDQRDYVIWFETGLAPGELDDTAGLTPFQHLIRTQAAIASLPHCAWTGARFNGSDREAAAWTRKTQALAASLRQDEVKFQKEFSTYLGTLAQAGIEARDGFGEGYDMNWWVGY